jgi:hypothetical protein
MSNLCHTDGSSIESELGKDSRNNSCRTFTDSEVEHKVELSYCDICHLEQHFATKCPSEDAIRQISKLKANISKLKAKNR